MVMRAGHQLARHSHEATIPRALELARPLQRANENLHVQARALGFIYFSYKAVWHALGLAEPFAF